MKKNANTTFPVWVCIRLLNNFGPSWRIQALIAQQGFKPPPIKTINGWRQRNSIPIKWGFLLVNLAIKGGMIESIDALQRQKLRKALTELAERRSTNPKPEWADL